MCKKYDYKKEWLARYGECKKREKELVLAMEALEARYMLPSKVIDGMPHGSGGDKDLSEFAAKYDAIYEDIKTQVIHSLDVYREVSNAIEDSTANESEKCVLRYRYVHGYTWEKIAVTMELSYVWVCKLHGRALEKIKIPENSL